MFKHAESLPRRTRATRPATRSCVAGAMLVIGLATVSSAAADWPNFRGPGHDGISPEKGFKKDWDKPMPKVWERDIGSGFSSFALVDGRLYTAGTKDGAQTLYCLDAATGRTVWEKPIGPEFKEPAGGDGPRATPTVDDGRVYMLGATGNLLCVDAASGQDIWRAKFSHIPRWGYSGSVLVEGDLALSSGGSGDGALVAFDKRKGTVIWKAGDDIAGYSTPYPFTFEGTRYIVGFTGESAIVVEAKTGKVAWRQPWKTDYDVNAAAPIFHDGHLFLSSGYQTGCALFKLRKSGDMIEADEVWRNKVLMNKFQSCILHGGDLYASDQNALTCVDFLTGKEHWVEKRLAGKLTKHGTLVLADGHLLYLMENGQFLIGEASPQGFQAKTSVELLNGRCWTVPVLVGGKLYARNLERLACFDLTGN